MAQLEWMRYKSAYENCLARGERLIRLLSDLPVDAPSRLSKWRDYQDLDRYYEVREARFTTQHRLKLHHAVRISLSPGWSRLVITHSHIEEKTIGGIAYLPTSAFFRNMFFPVEGIIVASSNYNHKARKSELEASLNSAFGSQDDNWREEVVHPPLTYWSDIVYLQMRRAYNMRRTSASGLEPIPPRWILQDDVKNWETIAIICWIVGLDFCGGQPRPRQPPSYDERGGPIILEPAEEGFAAILGSPNGRGIAWLLIQHADVFGRKEVKSIRIWRAQSKVSVEDPEEVDVQDFRADVLFEIGDVE